MDMRVIGITMGDAAGIGPEIIVKALADPSIYSVCRPVVIGDKKALLRMIELLNLDLTVRTVETVEEARFEPGKVDCLDLNLLPESLPFGKLSAEAGHAAFQYLTTAISLAMEGKISAICTAPLNKEALHLGGHFYPGHTEILAEYSGTVDFGMMLAAPNLKVVLVTIHTGLVAAVQSITPDGVYRIIRLADDALHRMGFSQPRIAVCGINPHAGENGLFGEGEEEEKVLPAIEKAVGEGLVVSGPYPADTIFYRAVRGEFDVVVAMYHDQGLIPIKTLGLEAGVNITIGLPFIRTSVDHGTAFDIAGKGIADAENIKVAIIQAAQLSKNVRTKEQS